MDVGVAPDHVMLRIPKEELLLLKRELEKEESRAKAVESLLVLLGRVTAAWQAADKASNATRN